MPPASIDNAASHSTRLRRGEFGYARAFFSDRGEMLSAAIVSGAIGKTLVFLLILVVLAIIGLVAIVKRVAGKR
jgi:hypothetical protein